MPTKSRRQRFPLLTRDRYEYPAKPICGQCRKALRGTVTTLAAGCLAPTNDNSHGFLALHRHGIFQRHDHTHDCHLKTLPLAQDTAIGQCEFNFCSPRCLLAFLANALRTLEQNFQREVRAMIHSGRRAEAKTPRATRATTPRTTTRKAQRNAPSRRQLQRPA